MASKSYPIVNDETGETYALRDRKDIEKANIRRLADGTFGSLRDAGFRFEDEPKKAARSAAKSDKEG